MNVKLISVTPNAEKIMAYCARVSGNQEQEQYAKLLKYCIEHQHWSVFEMADMTVEIVTSRAISQQILRHKSFSFQEFSQRYAEVTEFEYSDARRQDMNDKQNSVDDLDDNVKAWFISTQGFIHSMALSHYYKALELGIAKECARVLLPLSTQTKLYMKGSVRSWIHYLSVRSDKSTQKEHQDIAFAILEIFIAQFPETSKAMGWVHELS